MQHSFHAPVSIFNQTKLFTHPAPLAWRERRLEFHDVALADVAAQFNRYNTQQIRIAGPLPANKRLTGIFNAHSSEALIQFLERDRSLAVERENGNLLIRQR